MFGVIFWFLAISLPGSDLTFNIRAPAPRLSATGRPSLERTLDVVRYLDVHGERAAPPIKESPVPVFRRDPAPDPVAMEKRGDPDPRRQISLPALDCRAPTAVQSIATVDACKGRKRSTQVLSSHQVLLLLRN